MAKIDDPELDPNAPFRDAMKALIAARFDAVWRAVPVAIEGIDPEGVHDVRVASRRLRAAMDVAAGSFPARWFEPLHATAKQITAELGEVRDRDVLIAFLEAEIERAPAHERIGIERLRSRVTRERDEARAHMLRFLERIESEGIEAESRRRFGGESAATPTTRGQ